MTLSSEGVNVDHKPRVLFLAHRIPYPPNKGDKIRSYRWLRALVGEFDVRLMAFVDDVDDFRFGQDLAAMGIDVSLLGLSAATRWLRALWAMMTGRSLSASVYSDRRVRQWLNLQLQDGRVACVVMFSGALAQYEDEVKGRANRLVVDFVDVDSEKWFQYAQCKGWLQGLYHREGELLRRLECRAAERADISVFISREERDLFTKKCEASRLAVWVGNGVDLDYFAPVPVGADTFRLAGRAIVFVGVMSYKANVDGVLWFVNEVLPLVQDIHRDATLYIVGSNPSKRITRLTRRGVTVTGRVDDVRPYLNAAEVLIAPLLIGRGVQNKVLEGMAAAKPMVVTSVAATGIGAVDCRDLLIADSVEAFADRVSGVLSDKWPNLGVAARSFVRARHCVDTTDDLLLSLVSANTLRLKELTGGQ